jgi:predicted SPOUT superfamily RNA methylase MTH1
MKRPGKAGKDQSWADIGLQQDCLVNMSVQDGTRVTIRLDQDGFSDKLKYYSGIVVS